MACLFPLLLLLINALFTKCDYQLIEAYVRNIVLIGRANELIEVLKDNNYHPGFAPIIHDTAVTAQVSVESFAMKSRRKHNILHFNVLSIPESFTYALNEENQSEHILHIIKKCIDLEITNINHFYLVISIQRGINRQEIDSFLLYAQRFLGIEDKISIIISFAQYISTQKQYEHYIDQFKYIPDLQPLYQRTNGRIFFLGAAQPSNMFNKTKLRQNVHSQRMKLLQHIVQQNVSIDIKQVGVYQHYLALVRQAKQTLNDCCSGTMLCDDDILTFDKTFFNDIDHNNSNRKYTYQNKAVCNVRNIIFIGSSEAAITSSIAVLQNKESLNDTGLLSIISNAYENDIIHIFDTELEGVNNKLNVNIMDSSPFFHRILQDVAAANTSAIILDLINRCIHLNFTRIHHVYLLVSVENGITESELEAFALFTDLFLGMEGKLSMIISTLTQNICNNNESEYDEYINQFKSESNPSLQSIYETIHGQIFFLCVIPIGKGEMFYADKLRDNVQSQKRTLFKHIVQQTRSYNVKSLTVYKESVFANQLQQKKKFSFMRHHHLRNKRNKRLRN